jgi:hypothetical protein
MSSADGVARAMSNGKNNSTLCTAADRSNFDTHFDT